MKRCVWIVLSAIFIFLSCEGQLTQPAVDLAWPQAAPASQGIDNDLLLQYKSGIERGQYGPVHSWLIWRNGFLVAEFYFAGSNPHQLHPVYSVSKSVTATLTGLALASGALPSLQFKVLDAFPEYANLAETSPQKAAITLEDLLTMRSGIAWDEGSLPYTNPGNSCNQMMRSEDWIGFLVTQPLAYTPGTKFRYNTGVTVLLGELVARRTQETIPEFSAANLFKPIGIDTYYWEPAPRGVTNCGGGLHLYPRDMLRIGVLYLNGGQWQGKQVVPAAWIEQCLQPHVILTNGFQYGYQWWRKSFDKDGSPISLHIAWGYGGQFIFLLPSLNMVMVSTGADYESTYEGVLKFLEEFVQKGVKS